MDLESIKKRLNAINSESNQGGTDYSAFFWRPELGKSTIRIVPSKFNKADPFTELKFHTKLSKYPILALTNFGAQDPVEEFRSKLQQIGGKDNWSMSGKLTPSAKYFVPVIVRGEEEKGVRLWSIGITLYKALLSLAMDDEIGDYTDVVNGTDMVVEKTQSAGAQFPETAIRAKRNSSPLSDDPKLVEKWLGEQPEPINCFRKPEYDYIKKQLEAFVTGAPAQGTTKAEAKPETKDEKVEAEAAPKVEMKLEKASKAKSTPFSKFDDLFGDDDKAESKVDDLPF